MTILPFATKIDNRTNVREMTEVNAMDKNEMTKILDEFSDAKLDMFLSFLRFLKETEDNEQLPEVSRRECS